MKKEEFVESLVVNDKLVNVGLDDYGQCYFFEYYDDKTKELKEVSCGTYNSNYKEEIEEYLKPDMDKVKEELRFQIKLIRDLENKIYDLEEKINGTKFNNEPDEEN